VWKDGSWGKQEWSDSPYLNMHSASLCPQLSKAGAELTLSSLALAVSAVGIQYGASCFEGLKAFRHEDGQVKLFRPDENSARLNHSAAALSMPEVPKDMFLEAVNTAVARNLQFVPPHAPNGASGSCYVRPTLIATGAELGLVAGKEFTFFVYVTPLGSLYGSAGGKAPGVDAVVVHDFDRAAPMGTGTIKVSSSRSLSSSFRPSLPPSLPPLSLFLSPTPTSSLSLPLALPCACDSTDAELFRARRPAETTPRC